jgi:hypothetical protein
VAISLGGFIEGVTFQEPTVKDNLAIFPLILSGEHEPPVYLLLEEALRMGVLEVGEVSLQGTVSAVIVSNRADQSVLILDGEEILGAKQNRMVNATVLIPAKKKVKVPVSCVERGRWRYSAPTFSQVGTFGYSTLRRQKTQQVSANLEFGNEFAADQAAIWDEIDRKQACMGVSSDTNALYDVYKKYEEELENSVRGLEPVPGQSGLAVFIEGRFVCLDLFDHPETLRKLWRKLLKSYAMEAIEARGDRENAGEADLREVLGIIKASECSTYPSVGLGNAVRLRGPGIIGAGLIFNDKLLHLCVFGSDEQESDEDGRMGSPTSRRRTLR